MTKKFSTQKSGYQSKQKTTSVAGKTKLSKSIMTLIFQIPQ